jgi:hypothetical protein
VLYSESLTMRWIASIAATGKSLTISCAPATACGDRANLRRPHSAQLRALRASFAICTRSAPVHQTPGLPMARHAVTSASVNPCRIVKI